MSNHIIDQYMEKVQGTVDQALEELMEVKMIRENDPTEYSQLQRTLQELRAEADLLVTLHPSHKEQLDETKEKIKEIEEVMIRGI